MLIIPAIDMRDGKTVRLTQGKFTGETVYSDSIVQTAKRWISEGATRLHLVDLDGALAGKPYHLKEVTEIAKMFPSVEIQMGGGIRDSATLDECFSAGVRYCILGTAAVKNPPFVMETSRKYPGRIILGVDARKGMVAIHGWEKESTITVAQLLSKYRDCPLAAVIYTDISRDGMLSGMDMDGLKTLSGNGLNVIASGGLAKLEDIDALKEIGGICGVIAGKALYEGRFTLPEAIKRGELAQQL